MSNKNMLTKRETIQCSCQGHHFLLINVDKEENSRDFYMCIVDRPDVLWRRIYNAIRYIVQGGFIYYSEVFLSDEDVQKLKSSIEFYEE
jgi:hypothetical protein